MWTFGCLKRWVFELWGREAGGEVPSSPISQSQLLRRRRCRFKVKTAEKEGEEEKERKMCQICHMI